MGGCRRMNGVFPRPCLANMVLAAVPEASLRATQPFYLLLINAGGGKEGGDLTLTHPATVRFSIKNYQSKLN